jgi:hypothetical protein
MKLGGIITLVSKNEKSSTSLNQGEPAIEQQPSLDADQADGSD